MLENLTLLYKSSTLTSKGMTNFTLLVRALRKVDNAFNKKNQEELNHYISQQQRLEKELKEVEALLLSYGVDLEAENPFPHSEPNTPRNPKQSLPPVDFSTPRQPPIKEETENEEEPA